MNQPRVGGTGFFVQEWVKEVVAVSVLRIRVCV